MCGIFGVYNYRISRQKAEDCLHTIKHRGPDGYDIFQCDETTLGHCRLAIFDTSDAGKQPMVSEDGRFVITYNGEIYNFIELRHELQKQGVSFHSDSDTEVVLAAYQVWGEECQNRFNGMWAFAIYDRVKKSLFLSRDRFGVKPLVYARIGSGYCFASEMKALLPILPVSSINYELLNNIDDMKYEASGSSLIKEIYKLEPGHCIFIEDTCFEKKRWWCTLDHLPKEIPKRYEEQVELFRELFFDACKLRMRSDVSIGTALSGGLDSSATICAMAHIAKKGDLERINANWQHAFVAGLQGTALDETKYAAEVTDYLNIDNKIINVTPEPSGEQLEDYLYMFEEVYNTSPIPMMMLYSGVKENGCTVTIDGHGADELFGGYAFDFFRAFSDARGKKEEIEKIMDAFYYSYPHDESNIASTLPLRPWKQYAKAILENYVRRTYSWCHKGWKLDDRHPNYKRLDTFDKNLYEETHRTILPTLLRNYDHYSMAAGVEIRMPFLDYRIVTLAFALNYTVKLREGYSKAIIRDAMEPYMPVSIARRRSKIGFNSPMVEWMQGSLKEYFEDIVSESDFFSSDLVVDAKNLRKRLLVITAKKEKATFGQAQKVWMELSPYLWEKAFYKKALKKG